MGLAAFLVTRYAQDGARVPPDNPLVPIFIKLVLASAVWTMVSFYFTLAAAPMRGKEKGIYTIKFPFCGHLVAVQALSWVIWYVHSILHVSTASRQAGMIDMYSTFRHRTRVILTIVPFSTHRDPGMKPGDVERGDSNRLGALELEWAKRGMNDAKDTALQSKQLPAIPGESWDGPPEDDHIDIRLPPKIAVFDRTTEPGRD
ncbi:hypothetical protein EST38_g9905 [Candolleomyces aberdarensis]|uniref:Uncharacterized protein n=1 Tax=Candolleomyces aberdarensis TaxID=2316362 RepID=A0A4Q2DC10_9AGAR|nr:hypothetical protein EST38_g9905 [Candolleomyces aberdarensis]